MHEIGRMEVPLEPFQIENIVRMNGSCVAEDNSIYEACCICYESFTNKSFINECLHPFCYKCITDWTKVKAVCPLCIRPITRILHNIRSQDDYDIEEVSPPIVDVLANIETDILHVDDTDTDSSYGGMESMDMDSDFEDSINYENDNFTDDDLEGAIGNFQEYTLDTDEEGSVNSSNENNDNEEEEDKDELAEESDGNDGCGNSSDEEDDANDFYNTFSDLDAEDELEDGEEGEEQDCESNEENDDDAECDNDSNYFDNFYEDAETHEYEEEHENELETYDASDDSDVDHDDDDYRQSSESDEDYYLSDRC